MAVISIVAGGIVGMAHGLVALVAGLSYGSAFLVWILAGTAASLLIYRNMRRNAGDMRGDYQMRTVRDDLLALGEAEMRRAALASSDGTTMSRLVRMYAERDSRLASTRENRRIDP